MTNWSGQPVGVDRVPAHPASILEGERLLKLAMSMIKIALLVAVVVGVRWSVRRALVILAIMIESAPAKPRNLPLDLLGANNYSIVISLKIGSLRKTDLKRCVLLPTYVLVTWSVKSFVYTRAEYLSKRFDSQGSGDSLSGLLLGILDENKSKQHVSF